MVKQTSGALLLSLSIDHNSERPINSQLCAALRDLMLSGGLKPGERLPASRTLAADLGVSRTTVIDAFQRLAAEGLIASHTGAGTFVSEALKANRLTASPRGIGDGTLAQTYQPRLSRSMTRATGMFIDRLSHEPRAFTTALPAFDAFPIALWSRQVGKHWRNRLEVMMGYGAPQGYPPLRRAVAAHLRSNRGIDCEPEQIFIVAGAQQAFHLIGTMLLDPGDPVWFENPGAIGARNSLVASGARLVPVPVDDDGLRVAHGLRHTPQFRLAFVTPGHQQPLGTTLSLARRFALLQAAEQADAMIIEDDYDGEFRYRGAPLPTLKSVDKTGRVIYVGTFSKTLFPALRIGYLLAPPALVDAFDRATRNFLPGVPSNPQAVVAEFIAEGHFATHIRRMRMIYAERHQVFLDAARERLGELLDVRPTETGLHTIGLLAPHLPAERVTAAARERGITVAPIDRFCIAPAGVNGLVLGFSGIRPPEIRAGVATLGEALESL